MEDVLPKPFSLGEKVAEGRMRVTFVLSAVRYKTEQRPSSAGEYAATFSPREKDYFNNSRRCTATESASASRL